MTDDDEEASDPRTPLPTQWLDAGEEASDLMDAPPMTRSTGKQTTPGDMKNRPLDTTSPARSTGSGDDMKNEDPARADVVPTDPPPPPPKKSRLTRPVVGALVVAGLAIGAALVRLLVR